MPLRRVRGTKAWGLTYEGKVAKSLAGRFEGVERGEWWHFADARGEAWCQTDVVVRSRSFDGIYVFECKLTDIDSARSKLRNVYVPVLRAALGCPVWGLVVVKSLSQGVKGLEVYDNLPSAAKAARYGTLPVLHWLGRGAL